VTRAEQLRPVQQRMDDAERELAAALAAARQRRIDAEARLAELQRYETDYHESFKRQAAEGLGSVALRDYRVFLGRLAEAVRQQQLVVLRAGEDEQAATRTWQDAARRAKGLTAVVARWQGEERRVQDRRDQRDTDERALGAHTRRGAAAAGEKDR
jgi:flagellar protein FliJ